MATRGKRPATFAQGRPCRQCGADEWRRYRNGKTRCAECDRRRVRAWQYRTYREDAPLRLWRVAKKRARKNGVAFNITVEDVRAVWPADGRCPALGIEMTVAEGAPADFSPTLDRLNPEWGYEPHNIAVISHLANRVKSNSTASDLERVVAWMRARGLN